LPNIAGERSIRGMQEKLLGNDTFQISIEELKKILI
jgi:hypothetical protein